MDVARDHIPNQFLGDQLSYLAFERPVVGFKMIEEAIDLNDGFVGNMEQKDINRLNRDLFLRIALFDIWLSNDDRNLNNNNLLMINEEGAYTPVAIDHEKIFNSGDLKWPIYGISYEDSLIYSNLYHRFLKRSEKTINLIDENVASLQEHIQRCYEQLDTILADIPPEWEISIPALKSTLHDNIFTEQWISSTEQLFREFASLTIKEPR